MTRGVLVKQTFKWGWLTVTGVSVYFHHGRERGSMQADMVQE